MKRRRREVSGVEGRGDHVVAVHVRVRVYPGTHNETRGIVVDDFGELAGHAVDVGNVHIAAARRWAVLLDAGTLVFVDSDDLIPDELGEGSPPS